MVQARFPRRRRTYLLAAATLAAITLPSRAANLLVNSAFEAGNSGFTTAYTYSPGNIVPEFTYDVLFNPHDAHAGAIGYTDHTGGGKMLAVNGAPTVNVKVWGETVPVTPNATYT